MIYHKLKTNAVGEHDQAHYESSLKEPVPMDN